jgi:hypothetical protein
MRHFARYSFSTAIDWLCTCFLVVRMRRLYRLNRANEKVDEQRLNSEKLIKCCVDECGEE